MKRKILFICLFVLLLCSTDKVQALLPYEILTRNECPTIELANAKTDGGLEKVACYDNYQSAKEAMNTTDNDNLVIIEKGIIIDSKYGVVDYDINYPTGHKGYIDVYTAATGTTTNGSYIRGGTPDEAALIDYDYSSKRVKIKVAGLVGWINKYDNTLNLYDIVPLSWVKTPQNYEVTSTNIVHNLPGNVYGTKGGYGYNIDRSPSGIAVGKYYSYDGHYFYTDFKTMLIDYKNNNYNNSLNKTTPYYNYYQYLSLRSKTSYNAENIDLFLSKRVESPSKLDKTGAYFVDAQNKYGINAILMMAIGINESGWGTSSISKEKNNLFGLNAIDATPGASANYFASVENCIQDYAYEWLSYGYADPDDARYRGAELGNKAVGANYRYASDPFWSEKAASYYFDIDTFFNYQDYNTYQLAMLNDNYSNTVYAKKSLTGDNIYQYKQKDSVISILEEVQGPEVGGNTLWYKTLSDQTLDANLNYIAFSDSPRNTYNWDTNYVYVPAAYFYKVGMPIQNNESTPPTAKEISSIVMEAGYKYSSNRIMGIKPNTSVATIKSSLTNTGGGITVTDRNGNTVENGNIGTGYIINITSGNTESLKVLIYGDTNGDGNISAVDYVQVKNHIMGTTVLNDIYQSAGDVNGDNSISAVDYVNIKNYIMGTTSTINN